MNLNGKESTEIIHTLDSLDPIAIQKIFSFKPTEFGEPDYLFYIGQKFTGGTIFFLDTPSNIAYFGGFYPLDMTPYLQASYLKNVLGRKKSFGLGTLAHIRTLLEAYKSIDGLIDSSVNTSNAERVEHLQAMKIPLNTTVPFSDYLGLSISYANKIGFDFSLPF